MEGNNKCKFHPQLDTELYCSTHKEWICSLCLKNHRQCVYPEHYTEIYEKLSKKLDQLDISNDQQEIINKFQQYIQVKRNDINAILDQCDSDLSLFIEKASKQNELPNLDLQSVIDFQKQKYQADNRGKLVLQQMKRIEDILNEIKAEQIKAQIKSSESNIVDELEMAQIVQWIGQPVQLDLIFRASEHGFKASAFHEYCSKQGPTVLIVRNSFNKIIGGFTVCEWQKGTTEYDYVSDLQKKSFLFSVTLKKKFAVTNSQNTICNSISHGPKWGSGHDLEIVDQCDQKLNRYYNFGNSFNKGQETITSFLGGNNFKVKEYEIFKVIGYEQ